MNILGFILILSVFIAILLGGHFFIYFSVVKFLAITSLGAKVWLGGGLLFLSVSFVLSSILAHYSEGLLARIIYSVFSFWLGMGWNLIMAFVVSWLVVGTAKMAGQSFDYKYLMVFSIIFMLVFSIWGAWNVYNPRIKNVTVKIKNLPQEWRDKKVIQLSDVHLGHIYGKKFLTKIVNKVNAQNPDMVFITGDLFDGMDGSLSQLTGPLGGIKAPQGVYFITGNHEYLPGHS
ncbi:MAG: Metallophosphoesterase [uncultured bacterium]|nr:MAG: Metallophosphoesterase [uncultured bacterium]KKP68499.1 MAG: Metallophosphoesterase [Candidatus Moranbacteria bacterium GW2011_GWE1_35_17]KKP72657.1 MAG: Metallophosphoesterase [Candidatus Moranbacteria bacterium GW2011_GWE2_35_164]KKP82686.1 MAG: Metallophosphoesterase [Candidatus Moranbacteria bacterium GW2011_GWF1_35_5]KKP83368.1 MAG: Metallophosphoesterase [Candidatus Moranbacteria bacterium GW2011_GWF2_35_54]